MKRKGNFSNIHANIYINHIVNNKYYDNNKFLIISSFRLHNS